MRGLLVILIFIGLRNGATAQTEEPQTWDKRYVDSAIIGSWKIEDPATLKMIRTSRDYFLRPVIIFKDRQLYLVESERHEWNWNFSALNQELEMADMEELLVQSYRIKVLDDKILILYLGKQEIVFHKVP